MVCINCSPATSSRYFCNKYVTIVAIVITNVTAAPIPIAVLTFLETPKKGHIPKNCASTILLTNMAVMNMDI